MDTTINPDSLLVTTTSLADLGYSNIPALIGLTNNLKSRDCRYIHWYTMKSRSNPLPQC